MSEFVAHPLNTRRKHPKVRIYLFFWLDTYSLFAGSRSRRYYKTYILELAGMR